MDCHEVYLGYYVLKSQETVQPFSTNPTLYNVYTCLYLQQQSDYNYVYSLLTAEFPVTSTVKERVTIGAESGSLASSSVCSDTAYATAGERVHVALQNGSESLGKLECPSILQGYFTYLGTTCNSTSVDVCTDTNQLAFNTTACGQNTIYSQNGTLDCVYHNTIGSYTYVTVYNEDSTVDSSTYYAFSCLVVSEAGVYTYASVKPTECEANQVSTSTPTGGYVTVFEETAACTTPATSSDEDLTYLYVIIALIALLIIITIIVLLICCIKCRKRQKDVESADDESDKGSEDSKSVDDKPDEDDSKPEEEEEQQHTKAEEDKQSVDSGFIPGKDETKQKKKRKRRRRKRRKRRMRLGEEGEEDEEDEEEGEEGSSSDNVAQTDESVDIEQQQEDEEETVTKTLSKIEETETERSLAHSEATSQDLASERSLSRDDENMEPDQLSKTEETMETDTEIEPSPEPDSRSKSSHSLGREGDDGDHSQNEDSKTGEPEPEKRSQREASVSQERNTPPLKNEDDTKEASQPTSRMDEDPKDEITAEKSEDEEGSGSDGEGDDNENEDVTLEDGKRIDGDQEVTEDNMDEEQGVSKKTAGRRIVPPGLLSKVLVTREMEEKSREKASRRKLRNRVGRIFPFKKSKKQSAVDENQDEGMNDPDMEDIDRTRFAQPVAPFMEQYHNKKDIEKKLDDAHYWDLPEDDNIVMQLDQIEEELEKEEQKEIERKQKEEQNENEKMDVDVKVIGNVKVKDGDILQGKEEADNVKDGEKRDESRSSSRADSPESKKVRKADSSSDLESDVFDLDSDGLPEGHIRNENGHIVRMADGKVYKPGQFQRHLKKARLKRIFNVPRLNRNKKGRPTGGIKDDKFGPEIGVDDTAEQTDAEKNEREDGRTSGSVQRSSDERRRASESRRRSKTVAFSGLAQVDQFGNPIEKEEQQRIDSSTVNRRKLRNRLFRKKKRKTEDLPPLSIGSGGHGPLVSVPGAEGVRPRELSNLVKVYGQPGTITSTAPRSTLPPTGLNRSSTSMFDRNQLQNFREGLSKDQQILEKTNTIGGNPLAQPLGVQKTSVEELSSEGGSNDDIEDIRNGNVELGSEDEFFLVGGPSQGQPEPLFTRVRPPPESDLARSLKSNHDQRHAIPWSIITGPPRRPHTDGNGLAKSLDAPRSADSTQRGMDDRRLRQLLEELYKDKKYFDHVIDTTEPKENNNIDDRDLAEHGRDFLLDRADFWEDRGPLPSRPPRTSLGMRLSRMQTMIDSGRVSMTSTITCTPPVAELPNQMPLREDNTIS